MSSFVFAQIQLDYNDFAKPGESFIVAIAKFRSSENIKIENFKRGNTWDFSGLKKDDYDTIRFLPPFNTAYGQYFNDATVARHYRFTKVHYLKVTEEELTEVGVIDDYLHINAPAFVQFSDYITQYKFPIKQGDTLNVDKEIFFKSAFSNAKYMSIDSIKSFINLKRHTEFTEQANLKTVMGNYNVLCEKTVENKNVRTNVRKSYSYATEKNIFWAPSSQFSQKVKMTTYRFYAKNEGIPIVEAIEDNRGNIIEIRYKYQDPLEIKFNFRNPYCKGGKNGVIDLVVRGGVPDYKYVWSNGDTTENIKNLKAGTYTVEVIDNKNMRVAGTQTLTEPADSLTYDIDIKQISCYGETDGKLKANVQGGVPPYYIVWSTNQKQDSITDLKEGIYGIIIRDNNRCVLTDSVNIYEPHLPLSVTFEKTRVTCQNGNDGTATAKVKGGTAPYFYEWSNSDTSKTATNLSAQSYTLKVTDYHGCIIEKEVKIQEPANPITIDFEIKNVSCYGGSDGSVVATVKGGGGSFEYWWSNGFNTRKIDNLLPGNYTFKVTDKYGCELFDMVDIKQPQDSIIIEHVATDVLCYGGEDGTIKITVTGGTPDYKYRWSNGEEKDELKNVKAQNYNVVVTDKNKCVATKNININQPEEKLSIITVPKNVSCLGGSDGQIKISVYGGTSPYTYKWNTGASDTIITNLDAGTYKITVLDSHNCQINKEIIIKAPKTELSAELDVKNATCFDKNDGSIFVNPAGGVPEYLFKWSGGGDVQGLTYLGVGEYTVVITDKYGCQITKTATISQPEKLEVDVIYNSPTEGNSDGKIEISISGGTEPYEINWANGLKTPVLENIPKGTYFLRVKDANNCEIRENYDLKGVE